MTDDARRRSEALAAFGAQLRSGKLPGRHVERCVAAMDAGGLAWPDGGAKFAAGLEVLRRGGCVALLGDRGVGKTQTAVELAAAYEVARLQGWGGPPWPAPLRARYWRAADLFAEELDRQHAKPKRRKTPRPSPIADARRCDLLLLDELHERKQDSEWERRQLFLILDERYAERRPTVLISNVRLEALAELLGSSAARRIVEDGLPIVLDWSPDAVAELRADPARRTPPGASGESSRDRSLRPAAGVAGAASASGEDPENPRSPVCAAPADATAPRPPAAAPWFDLVTEPA